MSFDPGMGKCVGEGCPRTAIYFNDGTGWEIYFEEESSTDEGPGDQNLTGIQNGPLVLYGWNELYIDGDYQECGLAMIEDGVRTCEPVSWMDFVFVVNDQLAYGLYDGSVIQYDGKSWGPLPGFIQNVWINRIWANETHLFGTMDAGRIVMNHDDAWEQLNTRTLQSFSAIWGFSENDVWAGTYEGGLFRFDGEAFEEIDWNGDGCNNDPAILGMWGSGGILYLHTGAAIMRVEDEKIEDLLSFPCIDEEMDYEESTSITSVWGNSPNEVFFSVRDGSFPRRECGVTYLL
jgi:hypothetical protein